MLPHMTQLPGCCIGEPSTEQLWQEAQPQVQLNQGVLVVDDSTLDKWYAEKMELVTRHWSGKHEQVVQGINLITLLWTQGDRHLPLFLSVL